MLLTLQHPPLPIRLGEFRNAEVEPHQPRAGCVFDVTPITWLWPTMLPGPITRLVFARHLARKELLTPPAHRELIEVVDEDALDIRVAQVRFDASRPEPLDVVVPQS